MAGGSRGGGAGPYADFRPRRGRLVPTIVAPTLVILFGVAAVTMEGANWLVADRVFLFLLGVAGAAFLTRFIGIRAVPTPEGLTIRNIVRTHHLEWAEIVRVQFGGGSPWAYVDTASAETIPVMAIQKADGRMSRDEAGRLAALIEYHSTPRD